MDNLYQSIPINEDKENATSFSPFQLNWMRRRFGNSLDFLHLSGRMMTIFLSVPFSMRRDDWLKKLATIRGKLVILNRDFETVIN